MYRYIQPIFAEVIAGVLAFAIVWLLFYVFFPDSSMRLGDMAIKAIPMSFAIIFFKIITGYYLMLWLFLRISERQLSHLSASTILSVILLSIIAILLLITADSVIQAVNNKYAFDKRFASLAREFFNPFEPIAKYVYSGVVASAIAPVILKLIRQI